MKLFPYLKMHGNARAAINRYKNIFNGSIQRFSEYKNSPLANQKNGDLIIHCELHFSGNIICMADMVSRQESDQINMKPTDQMYQLCLNFDSDQLQEANRIFKAFSQDGEVLMKFEKTFWGAYYGKVKDSFGIIWSLNCEIKKEEQVKGSSQNKSLHQKKGSEKKQDYDQVD